MQTVEWWILCSLCKLPRLKRRLPDSCCCGGKASGNRRSVRIVLPWRWRAITWGSRDQGGSSSQVQDQLKASRFRQLIAPLLQSWRMGQLWLGRCWWWQLRGQKPAQGCSADSSNEIRVCRDPGWSVVTWGNPSWRGNSSRVQDQLKVVQQVQAIAHLLQCWRIGQLWLGQPKWWWWQLSGQKPAQGCSTGLRN